LPLPRSVGVASVDELFCAGVTLEAGKEEALQSFCGKLQASIGSQLPEGIELFSVELHKGRASFVPVGVDYEFCVKSEFERPLALAAESLRERLERAEPICVDRRIDKAGRIKKVEVGRYIESLDVFKCRVSFSCVVGSGGSVRPDEVLGILGVLPEMQVGGLVRKDVRWRTN